MIRWWHTVHHYLGKITFPDTKYGQELDTEFDTRLGQELDTKFDTWTQVKSLTQRLTQHLILAGGGHGNMQGRGQVLSVKTRGQPGQRRECSTSTRQQHTSYVDTHADKEVQVNRRCESLSSGSGA